MLPVLKNEDLTLRSLKLSDAPVLAKHLDDKKISRWTLHIPFPYKERDAKRFIRRSFFKIRNMEEYTFGIFREELCGVITLMNIDHENSSAEVGYWLAGKFWGEGIMTDALRLVAGFAFEKERFHRLFARLFAENTASARVLEKAGFSQEGRMRETRYRYGRLHDELLYSLLRGEWK